jgi:hypothetical protein
VAWEITNGVINDPDVTGEQSFEIAGDEFELNGNHDLNGDDKSDDEDRPKSVMAADAMGTAAGKPGSARTAYRNDGAATSTQSAITLGPSTRRVSLPPATIAMTPTARRSTAPRPSLSTTGVQMLRSATGTWR